MAHSGGPIRPAKSLNTQLGIPSGPMDLWSFGVINLFSTASSEITELSDNKEFWKITKPFMSHKGSSANTDISLIANDAIINDQTGVATVLNDYYVNVTKSIGQPDLLDVNEDIEDVFLAHESHESVQYIEQ